MPNPNNQPRPILFSQFEHVTPDLVPAVGAYRGNGLSIAISGQNGADVYNALGRATGVQPLFCRRWVSHVKLAEWLHLGIGLDEAKFYSQATRIEPAGRYRKLMEQGLDPFEAQQMAFADPLDGVYFGVGGPISRANQSGNRDVSLVILGDWNK